MNCIFVNTVNYLYIAEDVLPIGALSLATVLKADKRHRARVLELNYVYQNEILPLSSLLEENIVNTAEYILEQKPDFVSLYTTCSTHYYAILIAEKIKQRHPSVIVALGGPHASLTAMETLRKYPQIDLIGIGEGEKSIIDIVNAAEKADFSDCRGIAYRNKEKVVMNAACKLERDLDKLPILDYSLLNYNLYGMRMVPIDVGRGCPFSCSFCSTGTFWERQYRVKSAERIYDEMLNLRKMYNINCFRFEHDLFVLNRELVFSLCELLEGSEYKFTWGCSSRIDTIDEELIQAMGRAGCVYIFFGIETGSPNMQKKIKKNLNLEKLYSLLPILDKYNMKPNFSFMYGFPDETEEELEATLTVIHYIYEYYHKNCNGDVRIDFHRLVVFPGTEIFEQQKNRLVEDCYKLTAHNGYNRWNDSDCTNMADDVEIFSHNYIMPGEINKKTYMLEFFYQIFYRNMRVPFDKTFHLLWDYYGSYLGFYYAFYGLVGSRLPELIQHKGGRLQFSVRKAAKLFEKFVETVDFGEKNSLIKVMFFNEYKLFMLSRFR